MAAAIIQQVVKKWVKRTASKSTWWPQEGSFDVDLYDEMGTFIKNYKSKNQSEKRKEKRSMEEGVLNLFKQEDGNFLKSLKKIRKGKR